MTDTRPANCRFRLRDEGKAYPRSGCLACGKTPMTGLGSSCSMTQTHIDSKQTGVILGLHKNRPPGDFTVLMRVTRTEYPVVDVNRAMKEHEKTGAYTHVWFEPVFVPQQEHDS